ncbi:hypothetical protein [Streptomyces sp. SID3343]|uniref:hypothetical protein n=1 Tax=Streptomyces sp. SID3343 TaxID=2690260 RepID=UPI00136E25BE|nr:hypothetical protein [Streptomyces sp. SID3343]MYW06003.1 hypothetical protein [Streptomyces sp. SID3343]
MSIAVDVSAEAGSRHLVEDFDDAFRPGPDTDVSAGAGPRRACPDCGVVLVVDADTAAVPDHAVCPSPQDPFGIRPCPGSGTTVTLAADPIVGAPAPTPRPMVTVLPVGLDWRAQPFSHGR